MLAFSEASPTTAGNSSKNQIQLVFLHYSIQMPTISMFYGIIVRMFFFDNKEHKSPHIHVEYQDSNAVISIPDGNLMQLKNPPSLTVVMF